MSHKSTAKANIRWWEESNKHSLDDAYKSHSTAKNRAWRYCEELCEQHNGRKLKVIHHNTYVFTAGFEFTDKETGELMFMYITPSYDTAVPL